MQDKLDHTEMDYRTCFSSDVGRRVLGQLLLDAGFFDTDMKTTEELAVETYAKNILKILGVANHPDKMKQFVNAIFEVKG